MNCFTCERNLSAYLDDELPMDERLEVEAHLDECEACRGEFELHQKAWEAAGTTATGAAPDGLWQGIERELQADESSTSLEEVALMVKGLASEIQDLRRTVDALRLQLEQGEWEERATEVAESEREVGDIRVTTHRFRPTGRPREASIEQLRRSPTG
ncbi:anti-sigma factor family protein [Candidatus Latescibacterota bacterium]